MAPQRGAWPGPQLEEGGGEGLGRWQQPEGPCWPQTGHPGAWQSQSHSCLQMEPPPGLKKPRGSVNPLRTSARLGLNRTSGPQEATGRRQWKLQSPRGRRPARLLALAEASGAGVSGGLVQPGVRRPFTPAHSRQRANPQQTALLPTLKVAGPAGSRYCPESRPGPAGFCHLDSPRCSPAARLCWPEDTARGLFTRPGALHTARGLGTRPGPLRMARGLCTRPGALHAARGLSTFCR